MKISNAMLPKKIPHPYIPSQSSPIPPKCLLVAMIQIYLEMPACSWFRHLGLRGCPQQSALNLIRLEIFTLSKFQMSYEYSQHPPSETESTFMPLVLEALWGGSLGPGWLTSAITCLVAGVSGVYRIFPTSRGLRAFQIMRERGLDSKFFSKSLQ